VVAGVNWAAGAPAGVPRPRTGEPRLRTSALEV
jgi:hypothetical protein